MESYSSFSFVLKLANGMLADISDLNKKVLKSFPRELNKDKYKLYVVCEKDEIVYVGITRTPIRQRLNYGFKVKGQNGYHGYKWKDLDSVNFHVYLFDSMDEKYLENIEAELVFLVRATAGRWPKWQNEIHFNNHFEAGRNVATKIFSELYPLQEQKKSERISDLQIENEKLKAELKKVNFNRAIDKTILGFHEANFTSAAADLLINPNPVLIHGTKAGKGLDFMVSIMNILAIKSDSRGKIIYLKEPISPKDGGLKQAKIETNDQKLNFPNLLNSIQNRGIHLLRVNKSIALNVYHYSLSKSQCFIPNHRFKSLPSELDTIKIDKYFDPVLYNQRLMEIDRLSKHHLDFAINDKKINEIARYKKSLHVT